ncbi:MAG: hypothetical protein ABSF96_10045 [Steroidobacteraceae bacterium]
MRNAVSGRQALLGLAPWLLAFAGCSSLPPGPQSLLEEKTGVTITVVGAPISFARVSSDASASARDYVTLVAVEQDIAGKYTQLFLLHRWSTSIRGAPAPPPTVNGGALLIRADKREITLQPLEQVPIDLSAREQLFVPYTQDAVTRAYATDFATMRLIAGSHDLGVRLPQEPVDGPFLLWRDGRPALEQFLKELNQL